MPVGVDENNSRASDVNRLLSLRESSVSLIRRDED
jgi:hypothetical protein